jgi:excisionase family DNA binding protein
VTGDPLNQPTCSVEEAADLLGVGRGTLYEAIRRDEFPGVLRVGRRIRISTAALRRFLDGADGSDPAVVDLYARRRDSG